MELRDFITTTINEIVAAVVLSQRYVTKCNIDAEVAPRDPLIGSATIGRVKAYENGSRAIITEVQFDVAVTTSDEQGIKGGAGIKVVGIDLRIGADAAKTSAASAVTRISFNVPVILPDPMQARFAKLEVPPEAT